MEALISQATDLILQYGYLIIFALAAADNFGLPAAGDVALLAGAAAAADSGDLQWHLVVLVALLGGLTADNASYTLGRFGGRPIVHRFVPSKFRQPIENRLHSHAGKTVVTARFIAGFRAGVPLLSGVTQLRYRTFVTYNTISVVLWAVGVGLLGRMFAESVSRVGTAIDTGGKIIAAAIILVLVSAVIVAIVRCIRTPA